MSSALVVAAWASAAALLFVTGANDVANALGTSVGSKALTIKQASVIAAIFELAGAVLIGGSVASTLGDGIVHKCDFAGPVAFVEAMLASLVASAAWVGVATRFSLPVSSTHAIIGAVVACALLEGGTDAVGVEKLAMTALSWVVSPAIGALVAGAVYYACRVYVLESSRPIARSRELAPFLIGGTAATLALFVVIGGPPALRPDVSTATAVAGFVVSAALLSAAARCFVVPRVEGRQAPAVDVASCARRSLSGSPASKHRAVAEMSVEDAPLLVLRAHSSAAPSDALEKGAAERGAAPGGGGARHSLFRPGAKPSNAALDAAAQRWFALPMVMTACCVSFGHGGNDIANAIGPLSEVLLFSTTGLLNRAARAEAQLWWVAPVGGVFIVLGLVVWGGRVMKTVSFLFLPLHFTRILLTI